LLLFFYALFQDGSRGVLNNRNIFIKYIFECLHELFFSSSIFFVLFLVLFPITLCYITKRTLKQHSLYKKKIFFSLHFFKIYFTIKIIHEITNTSIQEEKKLVFYSFNKSLLFRFFFRARAFFSFFGFFFHKLVFRSFVNYLKCS
jgi:hypothetical protein